MTRLAFILICLIGTSVSASAEMITYRFEGINTSGFFGPKDSAVSGTFAYTTDLPVYIQTREETAYRNPWPTSQPDVYFQIHYANNSFYSTNSTSLTVMNDAGQDEPAIVTYDGIMISGGRLYSPVAAPPLGYLVQIFLRDNSHSIFDTMDIPSDLPESETFDYMYIFHNQSIYAEITSLTRINNGDLDGDGFVGINDLNTVLSNWNQAVTFGDRMSGDPSGDAFVGIQDLNLVLGNWNAGTPPGSPENPVQAVPEPASLALMAVCALILCKRGGLAVAR